LTWSHAEFVITVDDYVQKLTKVKRGRSENRKVTQVAG
jgi:hypothetical protein